MFGRKKLKEGQPRKFQKATIPEPANPELDVVEPSLMDNISNEGIKFNDDHFEMQVGLGSKRYGRASYLKPSGYPSTVGVNWLEPLLKGGDMDVSIHVDPISKPEAVRKLKDKMDEFEAVIYSAQKRGDQGKIDAVRQEYIDAKFLREQIRLNQNGLYYVSVSNSIYAPNLDDLNEASVNLETAASGNGLELVNCYDREKEGWLSTMPLATNYIKRSYRNIDRTGVTALFPHLSSTLNHDGGMPIGIFGNEYIYFNNFDRKLTNYNLGIFGESGAGKGVFVKQLIGRGFMDGIGKVVIIDVEPEYRGLTYALGGVVIELRSEQSKEASSQINPFDIYVEKEVMNRYQPDEYIVEKVNLHEKVKEMIEFFKVMKESAYPTEPFLTPYELNALDEILWYLYRDVARITEQPDSLYETVDVISDTGEITYERRYKRMPQVSDVYKLIQKKNLEGETGLGLIESVIKSFVRGNVFGLFDCQTNIITSTGEKMPEDALDKAAIVDFDISKLSTKGGERALAQHVLMTWIWNRFIVNDPKTKKRVIQDEAWMMLDYPSMVDFFKVLSARGRKWNVSLTLVSQRYEKFEISRDAKDVISQLSTVAFMKQPDQDIEPILKTFRFSDDVGGMIRTAETGDVILKAGKEIVYFKSVPTPSEWRYINTNQNISVDALVNGGR